MCWWGDSVHSTCSLEKVAHNGKLYQNSVRTTITIDIFTATLHLWLIISHHRCKFFTSLYSFICTICRYVRLFLNYTYYGRYRLMSTFIIFDPYKHFLAAAQIETVIQSLYPLSCKKFGIEMEHTRVRIDFRQRREILGRYGSHQKVLVRTKYNECAHEAIASIVRVV